MYSKKCVSRHRSRPKGICNMFINTTQSRVQRGTPGEGSTVIAPKHQPLISLNTNWCSMLTSFTLISGIKKNTGCNVRKGWERGLGGWQDWGNYPLMLHQTHDERGGGRKRGEKEKETVQRKLQVAWGERRNGKDWGKKKQGDWQKKRETSEGGIELSLKVFCAKVNESMRWNWWRAGGWRKQAHKCWLYPSHLVSCAFQPCPPLIFNSNHPSLTLPFILLLFHPALPSCLLSTSSSSHLLSSLAPSTHLSLSSPLLFPPLPSSPVYPYSQLVQYRDLYGQLYDREGGYADTEGNTLRAAVHAACCCSTPVCKFYRACEGKW